MQRRELLKRSVAAGASFVFVSGASGEDAGRVAVDSAPLLAGFARETITPPLGTAMMGFGARDKEKGCQAIHDDIYVRALFLEQGGERILIVAYDLCFLGREEADRFKGALGRALDLAPRQILLNASHNHVGPSVGTWYWAGYRPPDRLYLERLERATLAAACRARDALRPADLSAHVGRSTLPLSRRKPDGQGGILFEPNPDGAVYDHLPVCLFKDASGAPLCLLFSVSAHPSMIGGFDISAEYPGVACRLLDEHLGATAAMFLQGVGGDAKPSVIGRGLAKWRPGTWEEMERAGRLVADETIGIINKGLRPIRTALRSAIDETCWPLQPLPPRGDFEAIVEQTRPQDRPHDIRCQWAARQIGRLDRGDPLPDCAGITLQLLALGEDLRIVAIEGEPVGLWGRVVEDFFSSGVTIPLGYSNGQGLYLPVSKMLPEGGYEVVSFWEYGYAAPLAAGMEDVVLDALARLRSVADDARRGRTRRAPGRNLPVRP